jgi:hypothetical protein
MARSVDVEQNVSVPAVHTRQTQAFGRRRFLLAGLAVPAIAAVLAACGDDTHGSGANPGTTGPDTTGPDTTGPDTTEPGTTTPGSETANTAPAGAIMHPTSADEVIVRLGYIGGLVPPDVAFANLPALLIAGDGRAYTPALTPAIFPGPLVPAINVRTIDEAGIQRILAVAAEANLLQAPPDYTADLDIADAPVTQLILDGGGGTFTHEAYALGLQDPAETKARNVLNGVVIQLGDLEQLVGSEHLGPDTSFVPEAYRLRVTPLTVEALDSFIDPVPTVVPWPDSIAVRLADATSCAVVPATAIGTLFSDASQRTFFREGDGEAATVYTLSVLALLPGDSC